MYWSWGMYWSWDFASHFCEMGFDMLSVLECLHKQNRAEKTMTKAIAGE